MPNARGYSGPRQRHLHGLPSRALLFLSSGEGEDRPHAGASCPNENRRRELIGVFVSSDAALPRVLNKREEFPADGSEFRLRSLLQSLARIQAAPVKQLKRTPNFISGFRAETGPLQTDDVDAEDEVHFGRDEKRWDVFAQTGSTLNHRQPPDPHELVEDTSATEERAVADFHVAAEEAIVRDNDAVADAAVVSDMRTRHQETVVANDGRAPFRCPAMDRAMLANHVAISDLNATARAGLEAKILRRSADHRAMANEITGAQTHRAFQDHVRLDNRSIADDNLTANDSVSSYFNLAPDLDRAVDQRRGVNLQSTPASLKLKYGARPSAGAPTMM